MLCFRSNRENISLIYILLTFPSWQHWWVEGSVRSSEGECEGPEETGFGVDSTYIVSLPLHDNHESCTLLSRESRLRGRSAWPR